jgi:threonine/homoserine/homoserine lactone efflux protein
MTIELWFALAAANFAASVAPGQNVALVGSAAVRAGLRGGAAAVAGILVAECVWSVLALALLLGARDVSPALFAGLQLASVVPLIWIGVCILRDPAADADTDTAPGARCSSRRLVLRGVLIGAANPLALVFFLSLLPGFVPAQTDLSDPATSAFFVSAVLASTVAGLAPWLVASGLVRGGVDHDRGSGSVAHPLLIALRRARAMTDDTGRAEIQNQPACGGNPSARSNRGLYRRGCSGGTVRAQAPPDLAADTGPQEQDHAQDMEAQMTPSPRPAPRTTGRVAAPVRIDGTR